MFELSQEPLVNVGQLVDILNRSSSMHSVGDREDALIRRILELFVDILAEIILSAGGVTM
jgi:hypothetical protein